MSHSFTPPKSILIIGGGFAGTLTAIKLLDSTPVSLAITVIEDRQELGRGVAYSTREAVHLVNGPARIFGLHPERPDHLVDWLRESGPRLGWALPDDIHDSSPPRWIYGTYVHAELQRASRQARPHSTLHHVRDRAVSLRDERGGVAVTTARHGVIFGEQAVLALGVFVGHLPEQEAGVVGHPAFVGNPWEPQALDRLAGARKLLIIGASLSMVDVVASMELRRFEGHYTVLSRRGQVVERRRTAEPWRDFLGDGGYPSSARELLVRVRTERRAIASAGADWQSLPLAIRPHLLKLWQGASNKERLRFARHLRAFWDVTAHRAAPEAYAKLEAARAAGRMTSAAGRVLALEPNGNGIAATLRWRKDGSTERVVFDGVINCRGHQLHDWRRIDDPLVADLLHSGTVRPHATGFGIDALPDGQIIAAGGKVSQRVFAIGHPLRGVAWESSSIGEQLAQSIVLAARLLESEHTPAESVTA